MPDIWKSDRPLVWSEEELERDRQLAITDFIERRLAEGTEQYLNRFRTTHGIVSRLFAASNDLRSLSGSLLCTDPRFVQASRFLTSPPTSADDLKTLVGSNPFVRRLTIGIADKLAEILQELVDPIRFPWLKDGRAPTPAERRMSIRWTTGLWAVERVRTSRRMESSIEQQGAVEDVLRAAGFKQTAIQNIQALEDLPTGTFADETYLSGVKCDVPVRLLNRRLLAMECKVSNSSVNSIKRLNREVRDKAGAWRATFGTQVYPAAVLAGVFSLRSLVTAQRDGVTIFWAHDLGRLAEVATESARALVR